MSRGLRVSMIVLLLVLAVPVGAAPARAADSAFWLDIRGFDGRPMSSLVAYSRQSTPDGEQFFGATDGGIRNIQPEGSQFYVRTSGDARWQGEPVGEPVVRRVPGCQGTTPETVFQSPVFTVPPADGDPFSNPPSQTPERTLVFNVGPIIAEQTSPGIDPDEQRVFDEINAARARNGFPPHVWNAHFAAAADTFATDNDIRGVSSTSMAHRCLHQDVVFNEIGFLDSISINTQSARATTDQYTRLAIERFAVNSAVRNIGIAKVGMMWIAFFSTREPVITAPVLTGRPRVTPSGDTGPTAPTTPPSPSTRPADPADPEKLAIVPFRTATYGVPIELVGGCSQDVRVQGRLARCLGFTWTMRLTLRRTTKLVITSGTERIEPTVRVRASLQARITGNTLRLTTAPKRMKVKVTFYDRRGRRAGTRTITTNNTGRKALRLPTRARSITAHTIATSTLLRSLRETARRAPNRR